MAGEFTYNAPQFFDFSSQLNMEDDANVEVYFDTDHEHVQCDQGASQMKKSHESAPSRFRKSISMVSLLPSDYNHEKPPIVDDLCNNMKNLKCSEVKGQRNSRLVKSASRDNLHKLAQPKAISCQSSKFVSMSEEINKFYSKTPDRFHSKSKDCLPILQNHSKFLTVPNSPDLATKKRVRCVHVLSKRELEDKEIADAKKYKIKANPINPRILQPLKPIHLPKKTNTVIEPFKLTESQIKPDVKPQETFEFHANPVPKSIYKTPKAIAKSNVLTRAATPRFSGYFRSEDKIKEQSTKKDVEKDHSHKSYKPTKTQPVPFSFEKRDQDMLKKREEFINKVFEQEKKAREFHARPPPKYLVSNCGNRTVISTSDEGCCNEAPIFKARPATVLYKKPFEPRRSELPLTEISEFELNTDKRAKERQEFEQELKEKEEKIERIRNEKQVEEEHREKELRAELRKKAEYKANPVRHYKELKIVPSMQVTMPLSPALHTAKLRNKENATNGCD